MYFNGVPGETHTVTVKVPDDDVVEMNESFTAKLTAIYDPSGPSGVRVDTAMNLRTITINNNDSTVVSFSAWTPVWQKKERDFDDWYPNPVVTLPAKLSQEVDVPTRIWFAVVPGATPVTLPSTLPDGSWGGWGGSTGVDVSRVEPQDFDGVSYYLDIPAYSTNGEISVHIVSDNVPEPDESLDITLTGLSDLPLMRAGSMTVSTTHGTAAVIVENDD